MAKITPSHLFSSISGKLCKKESTYIAINHHTGQMYSGEYHGCDQPNSEAQQAIKATFTSKAKLAAAWWRANKPSEKLPKGSDNYQLVVKAYKGQHKIGNPYSYLRTLIGDDLKVKLGDLDITGDVSAGGGSASGGSSSGSQGGGSSTGNGGGSQGSNGDGEG